ncbi:hypothetical protein AAZX31_05G105300 [Glycine max]|nr:hypothetical protein GmHk_05G013432 [Glycine max]
MNLRSLVFAESEKLRLDHIYYLILGLNFNSLYCLTLSLTPSTFFFSLAHSTPFLSQSPLNHHHCDSRGDSASTTDVPSTSFNKVFGICLRSASPIKCCLSCAFHSQSASWSNEAWEGCFGSNTDN